MNKKVIDVIPPEEIKKEEKIKKENKKERLSSLFIFLFLILVGIFVYLYFALPLARIEIWPKTEGLNLETILRTELIETLELETKEVISQQFAATEKLVREKRAEGIIRLYNRYSTTPQSLRTRTRFLSPGEKQFRTPVRVVIPGKRREAGRWIPGTVDIRVVADQPGKEFNIGPTYFSIPGLLGLAMYHEIYGRSYQPMTGGLIEEATRVSEKDLRVAEHVLEGRIKDKCLTLLRDKILPGFNFPEEEIEIEILERTVNVKVGAEVEEFNFQIRIKCRVLAFKTEDIENFAKDFILAQLPENKRVVPESLRIDKSVKDQTIDLNLTVDIYPALDKPYLQERLVGKSLTAAQLFLRELKEIDRVYVDLWPFWVGSVPENLERIKIELKF